MNEILMSTTVQVAGLLSVIIATLIVLAGVLMLCIKVVNHFGKKLWDKLLAYYNLTILQDHLRQLEYQGKLAKRTSEEE